MVMDFLTADEPLFIFTRMVIIVIVTVLIAWRIRRLTNKIWKDKLHVRFMCNIISVIIYVVGGAFALDQIPGFSNIITTLLAGSGIAVLGISLAAQETLSNLISGITISTSRPFDVGDRIHLTGSDTIGYVEDITLRHTVIRTFVNSRIIIPNAVISKELIENSNFHAEPVANFLDATITYDSDLERAMEIMAHEVSAHPNYIGPKKTSAPDIQDDDKTIDDIPVDDKPPVTVYVRNLSVFGIQLRCSVWTRSINENFDTCSEIRRNIKLAYDEAGIKFAVCEMTAGVDF